MADSLGKNKTGGKMKGKMVLVVGVVFLLSMVVASNVFACWGARPLSMGGAFVAVADDVHSIYWNPAGLAKVKSVELTYTRWLNLRDEVNYDDFAAGAFPLGKGTLGIGYTYNQDKLGAYEDVDNWLDMEKTDHYVNLGYGISLNDKVSVGLNVNYHSIGYDIEGVIEGVPGSISDSDIIFPGLDLGFLWDINPKFTIGVLLQDFNEPEYELFGEKGKYISNLRPGIAWKPTDKITVALDMYDALNNSKGQVGGDLRIGTEAWVTENLAIRAGAYHFNNDDVRAYTAGLGFRVNKAKGLRIDYGLMYWDAADEFQHMLAVGYKF